MFGMSSEDFWENDPKLYWAYRIFYLKSKEIEMERLVEQMRYDAWLKGSMNYMAVSLSLNNAFNKQKQKYPTYDEFKNDTKKENRKLTKEEQDLIAQDEFNYWD